MHILKQMARTGLCSSVREGDGRKAYDLDTVHGHIEMKSDQEGWAKVSTDSLDHGRLHTISLNRHEHRATNPKFRPLFGTRFR